MKMRFDGMRFFTASIPFSGDKPKARAKRERGYNGAQPSTLSIPKISFSNNEKEKVSVIREMTGQDGPRILEIYKMGLETRNATFETEVPSWADWGAKHLSHSRFVFVENEKLLGWIALSPVSARKVYSGVAEVSVYVNTDVHGKGIGSNLMEKIVLSSEEKGIWTLYSSIFPENEATLRLHEKFGFRIIGRREKIAKLDGRWRDTILLERRSKVIGIE
jgi:L-amino acid N-acyltransferase YncA